ncbi:hypothetical protein MJO29_012369 [Puccinia striiformis f. sp. tritici]|nr:hypothetical protein MJO29_012369 [Puccinia striiformis f. sp. tritici]
MTPSFRNVASTPRTDSSFITFDAFKEAVISRIGQVDRDLVNAIEADWALAAPRIQCGPVLPTAVMPTEHDQMFKQWIWGINIRTSRLPDVSIIQDLSDTPFEGPTAVGGHFT